jgi:fatty acid-binding protein DegV
MLTIQDGEFLPVNQFRSRPKGIDKLFSYAKDSDNMEEMAIIHSTTHGEAQSLAERINSTLHPKQIRIARLGPALGVHGGPGVLAVAFRRKNINP